MVNYAVPPEVLQPFVPRGTVLDTWGNQGFISLVAFQFQKTRVLGLPVPLHQDFEEVNLRFYVRRDVSGETRHGVVFLREVVGKPLIATAARLTYNEPYKVLPTRHHIARNGTMHARYGWKVENHWESLSATASGEPVVPADGTFETFISDKPWGFTRQAGGGTIEYRVRHPRWRLWSNPETDMEADLGALCGDKLQPWLKAAHSSLIAEGSPVTLFVGSRIR